VAGRPSGAARRFALEWVRMAATTKDSLRDVEDLLYNGYLEEDFFLAGHCITFRTLSTAEEREMWLRYRNVRSEDHVHFALDLLATALHRVNGRRVGDPSAAWEFLWRLPKGLLGAMYTFFRARTSDRLASAQEAVREYSESAGSRSLWAAFKVTGTLPSPDFDFRRSNIVQHLWFVVNQYRDEADEAKAEWSRAQFVADQICMFTDPKAFRQMAARRDARKGAGREHDAEEDILAGIMEMMLPDDRRAFLAGVVDTEPEELTMFLDRIPRQHLESHEEYKERVCAALERVCDAMDAEDDLHTQVMAERAEGMVLDFIRRRRGGLALRNLSVLLELMGPERLEAATPAEIAAEVDIAVAERGSGYELRLPSDEANYSRIMACDGEYKHAAFVPPARRRELLAAALAEPLADHARLVDPGADPYLVRKANGEADGPRGPDEPRPPEGDGGGGPPPGRPPTGPAGEGRGDAPLGADPEARLREPPPPEPPAADGDRPSLADLVNQMAEQYRSRHPGVDDVAKRVETVEHTVESLGDWEDTAQRKVSEEPPPPPETAEEEAAAEKARAAEARETEEDDAASSRRESALSRRNEAVEALRRAKRKAGVTPEMEREAFMDEIRRIARGDPDDPPEPPAAPGR